MLKICITLKGLLIQQTENLTLQIPTAVSFTAFVFQEGYFQGAFHDAESLVV